MGSSPVTTLMLCSRRWRLILPPWQLAILSRSCRRVLFTYPSPAELSLGCYLVRVLRYHLIMKKEIQLFCFWTALCTCSSPGPTVSLRGRTSCHPWLVIIIPDGGPASTPPWLCNSYQLAAFAWNGEHRHVNGSVVRVSWHLPLKQQAFWTDRCRPPLDRRHLTQGCTWGTCILGCAKANPALLLLFPCAKPGNLAGQLFWEALPSHLQSVGKGKWGNYPRSCRITTTFPGVVHMNRSRLGRSARVCPPPWRSLGKWC